VIPRVALALAAAALVLLPAHPAEGGGKHRKYPKREVAQEVAPEPAVEEEAPQGGPRPRYPLYLDYGEAASSAEYAGPSVPPLEDLLPLLSPARFAGDPWGCLEHDEGEGNWSRLLNRYAYLKEKAYLLGEMTEASSHLADMAESLAAAGEWSEADSAVARANARRLDLLGDEATERVLAIMIRYGGNIGAPRSLLRDDRLHRTRDIPEAALPLLDRAKWAEKRVLAYEEEILPALEKVAAEAAQAHRNGQVGYSLVVRRLGPLFEARAEHMEQLWRFNELVLDLEHAIGRRILPREEDQ